VKLITNILKAIIVSILFFCSCKTEESSIRVPKKYGDSLISQKTSIHPKKLAKYNFRFREQICNIYGLNYLVYLNEEKKLTFLSIFDTLSSAIDISQYVSKLDPVYSISFSDSNLLIFNKGEFKLYDISITKALQIKKIDSFDLSVYRGIEKFPQRLNPSQAIVKFDKKIYFPIASNSERNNFSDNYLYLVFDLSNPFKIDRIIKTPIEFLKGRRKSKNTYLFCKNKTDLIVFFESLDKIITSNLIASRDLQTIDYNPYSEYDTYHPEKSKDLGYTRKYLEINESNEFVLPIGNDYFLVIKRMKRENFFDKKKYEYLVLNKNFELKFYNVFKNEIHPRLAFEYKNGFVIFNQNLSESYFYAVQ
jgi:hypothetical protein